jgi:FtsH-binding integral membrane protein
MQQALEDIRQERLKTQSMYRKVALFCAIGAVCLLVAGYLTKYSEATGAAAILGGSSLVCAWLSVAMALWWLILIAAVLLVAIYVACKMRGFHAPEAIKNKIKKIKEERHARTNRDIPSEK